MNKQAMKKALPWVLLGIGMLGCFGKRVTAESSFKEKGLNRASFELSCPQNELTMTVLTRNDGLGCAGSIMGVSGCGKKATYVCTREQDWILNGAISADEQPAAPAEPEAPATES